MAGITDLSVKVILEKLRELSETQKEIKAQIDEMQIALAEVLANERQII